MYLATRKRPDLAGAASILPFYLHNYTDAHIKSVKREMRYLRKTLEREMTIIPNATTQLTANVDARWRRKVEKSRRNCSGILLTYVNDVNAE